MNWIKTIIAILFLISFHQSEAQIGFNPCQDSTIINQGNPCNPEYMPICGCNNVTYRNLCFAHSDGVFDVVDGSCEFIDFDFNPNPVIDRIEMKLNTKASADVNIYIFDLFGNLRYFYVLRGMQLFNYQLTITDVSTWDDGLYFLAVESNGQYIIKRMLKNNNL
jgi:hypothetical protein